MIDVTPFCRIALGFGWFRLPAFEAGLNKQIGRDCSGSVNCVYRMKTRPVDTYMYIMCCSTFECTIVYSQEMITSSVLKYTV